jgi:tetratricopeptide (TPR) repeat protein
MVFFRERTMVRDAGVVAAAAVVSLALAPCSGEQGNAAKAARLCAFAYFRLDKLERSEECLKKEMELVPASPGALALLASVYFRQGRGTDAESVCRDFVGTVEKRFAYRDISGRRRTPEDSALEDPNLGLLACHLQILDAEVGRQGWESVLALAPELWRRGGGVSAEARTFQAIALDKKGFDLEALDCLGQAVSIKPLAPWALKNLAIYYLNRSRFEESLALIRKVLRVAPEDFLARFLLEPAESRRHAVDREHYISFTTEFMEAFAPVYRHTFQRNPEEVAREL